MSVTCPICESGNLEAVTVTETIVYGGVSLHVPGVQISRCSACAEEIVMPAQLKENELLFADSKRSHDGLLRSEEIIAWRKSWNLTQLDAAALLGGGANAFSKYERGEVLQSRAMDLLIRATEISPEVRRFLSQRSCVPFANSTWESFDSDVAEIAAYKIRSVQSKTLAPANDELEWITDDAEYARG